MKLKPNLAISESGFIFDPSTGESYSTNPTGVEIFSLMNKNLPQEEIKRHFMDEYEVDESSFERNFLDFVAILRQYNLIEQ